MAVALPTLSGQAAGGSMLVRRPGPRSAVPLEDLDNPIRRDADLIGTALGITLAESRVAVLLAEGKTVPDIAALYGRAQTAVRTHLSGPGSPSAVRAWTRRVHAPSLYADRSPTCLFSTSICPHSGILTDFRFGASLPPVSQSSPERCGQCHCHVNRAQRSGTINAPES